MTNNVVTQLRSDTASNFTTGNPTLELGEMGLESDTNKFKFGDGSTAWNSLDYAGGGGTPGTFKYGLYTLSANQTSNLSVDDHIEFDTSEGSLGGLSTGSGQENGIITLTGGKTYKISGAILTGFSSADDIMFCVYDRTNSTYIGKWTHNYATTYTASKASQPTFLTIVAPTSNIDIDVRVGISSSANLVNYGTTWLLIEEYAGY